MLTAASAESDRVVAARLDVDGDVVGHGQRPLTDSQTIAGLVWVALRVPLVLETGPTVHTLRVAGHGVGVLPVGAGRPALGGGGEERARILRGGKQHHTLIDLMSPRLVVRGSRREGAALSSCPRTALHLP